MKNLLIAIILALGASTAHAGIFDLDTNSKRPRLLIKTSAWSLLNWRTELSFVDIGAEVNVFDRFTIVADIGKYYRSRLSSEAEYSRGFYTDASLRYYPETFGWSGYYLALQYRHQKKVSLQEVDFTEAGLPYRKLIDANRRSHYGLLMFGSNRQYFFERLYFDWNIGLGVEYRKTDLSGLVDYELEAIETGEVDGIKYDDAEGRLLPAYHFEIKLGFRMF